MKTNIEMVIEKTSAGYSAFAKDYPVATVGDTAEELYNNMLEAVKIYSEEANLLYKPTLAFKMSLDLPQFLEFIRSLR